MKIGIISHPPTWSTGFGVTCLRLATGFARSGHEVVCAGFSFGLISPAEDELADFPFRIWEGYGEISEILAIGNFLKEEDPDVIIINYDIGAAAYIISLLKVQEFKKRIFAHIVIDGFPATEALLQAIDEIDGVIVPTRASLKYLRSEGLKKVYYAPHGVDTTRFFPLNKDDIRAKLNLAKDMKKHFIIGVFAKNDERKQIPKILLAMHHLIFNCKQKNILLYLHSEIRPVVGTGWDLDFIATYLKIKGNIIFTEKDFLPHMGIGQGHEPAGSTNNNKRLSYLERINMCDVIVNIPFSGGFELCNLEAQACGIPLITIDDEGNVREVVGDSALLIKPKIKNIWTNGAIIHLIDEIDLAGEILRIRTDTDLRHSLQKKGFSNIKRYPWSHLEKAAEKLITS